MNRIVESMKEAVAITRGELPTDACRIHIPEHIDVKAIRGGLGLSQATFAARFLIKLNLR